MIEQKGTIFPSNGERPAPAPEVVMLEGMKVLFDDKAGLYPVDLVAVPPESQSYRVRCNGYARGPQVRQC